MIIGGPKKFGSDDQSITHSAGVRQPIARHARYTCTTFTADRAASDKGFVRGTTRTVGRLAGTNAAPGETRAIRDKTPHLALTSENINLSFPPLSLIHI